MRKRRNSAKGDIIIDLTSLLDVVFILLLVILCGQSRMGERLSEAEKSAEAMKTQAEAEYKLYHDQLEIAESLNQYVCAVSVVVPYEEDEITQRQIRVLREGEEIENFDLIGNNVERSIEAFKECLVQFVRVNQERPVILSLNEEDDYILYRDEVMVKEIFDELAGKYSNVYIKGNTDEEIK